MNNWSVDILINASVLYSKAAVVNSTESLKHNGEQAQNNDKDK